MAAIRLRSIEGALIAILMALVLSSCSVAPIAIAPTPIVPGSATTAPTAVAGAAISEQAAIAAALKFATLGDGHILPGQESPKIIEAKLLPADQARDQSVAYGVSMNAADSFTSAIWLITLDGTWALNGPPQLPGITPPPSEPLHQLVIVLDAGTAAVRFVSGKP